MDRRHKFIFSIIFLFLVLVCSLLLACFLLKGKDVRIDNINSDEIVIAYRYQNYSTGFSDVLMVVNKDRRIKVLKHYEKSAGKSLSLEDFDKILKDKTIPYENVKLVISDKLLNEVINTKDYKWKESRERGIDEAYETFYSVYGSGKKRKLVVIRTTNGNFLEGNNQRIQELCDNLIDLLLKVSSV